mmetsp:Transcript_50031/g.99671  ORF Transcript_50031/g.99671 Transcript_50031/m.99671 type:complete len:82 (-) Transcript_50031:276-521(-)
MDDGTTYLDPKLIRKRTMLQIVLLFTRARAQGKSKRLVESPSALRSWCAYMSEPTQCRQAQLAIPSAMHAVGMDLTPSAPC